jgi:uroporphyrinogen decarboxylase
VTIPQTTRLLDACRGKAVDATPIWLMRQAGRYLPEYRALREKLSFIELCRRPDVAAEVTLQPLARFDLDAAIIFADILLPLEGMGIGFHFDERDGPVIEHTVRRAADLEGVHVGAPRTDIPYVYEALRLVARELAGKVPLIGFAGAPFTLASYVIEGGHSRDYARTKTLMLTAPDVFERLMALLADTVVAHLLAQIEAGAQVLQLFDSWAGALGPRDYARFVAPHSKTVCDAVSGRGVPLIHFAAGAAGMVSEIHAAGGDVIGLDWRVDLDRARRELGDGVAVQGNLDPAVLLGPPDEVERHATDVLRRAQGRPGHIFNLGHGVLPATAPDTVARLIEFVHSWPGDARDEAATGDAPGESATGDAHDEPASGEAHRAPAIGER